MKIVFLGRFEFNRSSGAAGAVIDLGDELTRLGHSVHYITISDMRRLNPIITDLLFPFFCAWKIYRWHLDADVIEATVGVGWLYYLLRRRKTKTLCVTCSHGMHWPLHERRMDRVRLGKEKIRLRYWLYHGSIQLLQEAYSVKKSDLGLFFNDQERRKAIQEYKLSEETAHLVRNGVKKSLMEASNLSSRDRQKRNALIQIGSYEERKGVETTTQAVTKLLREREGITISFIGTARPIERTLQDYDEDLWPRIEIIPYYRNDNLAHILNKCDISLMPSTYEAFGIAPLEAMACGVVPVVTQISGPATYMQDGENGLTIPVDDPDALRKAIERLIDDDAIYKRCQDGGLKTVASYDWSDIARERILLYKKHIGLKSGLLPKRSEKSN